MNTFLLVSLLAAHVLGDFYCQTDNLCKQKEDMKIKSTFLYIHSIIIFILSWGVVARLDFAFYAFIIAALHFIIDLSKSYCKSKGLGIFIADQLLHFIVILLVSSIYQVPSKLPLCYLDILDNLNIPLLFIGMMLCIKPCNILIKLILKNYSIGENKTCDNIKNAGALIGNLERILTVIFVLIGQYEAIGFVIAAKSILRFKDTDTAKTEYVLAGTFLSFGLALIIGLVVKHYS